MQTGVLAEAGGYGDASLPVHFLTEGSGEDSTVQTAQLALCYCAGSEIIRQFLPFGCGVEHHAVFHAGSQNDAGFQFITEFGGNWHPTLLVDSIFEFTKEHAGPPCGLFHHFSPLCTILSHRVAGFNSFWDRRENILGSTFGVCRVSLRMDFEQRGPNLNGGFQFRREVE